MCVCVCLLLSGTKVAQEVIWPEVVRPLLKHQLADICGNNEAEVQRSEPHGGMRSMGVCVKRETISENLIIPGIS